MTREDQKRIRELKKSLERTCREAGKRRGWRTIAGAQYRVQGGVLYILYVSVPPIDCGRMLSAWLRCKPLILDEMYWSVFHMAEEAAKQPFSFHVNGAFTAPELSLGRWKEPLSAPESLESAVESVFCRAEALTAENAFPDIAAFRARLESEPSGSYRTLNTVLCLLCEGNDPGAMAEIESALSRGENGGFLRMNGRRSILEDARDWCAARLEKGGETAL